MFRWSSDEPDALKHNFPGQGSPHSVRLNYPDWEWLEGEAAAVIEAARRSLPPELAEAGRVPLIFQPEPSPEIVAEGIFPDTLGLFVGEDHSAAVDGSDPLPGEIILFLTNIWRFVGARPEKYREEVEVTWLHELGHYLAFDEDDLEARGLD